MKIVFYLMIVWSFILVSCKAQKESVTDNIFTIKILLDLHYNSNCYYYYQSKDDRLEMMCYNIENDTCSILIENFNTILFKGLYEKIKTVNLQNQWQINDTKANHTNIWIRDNEGFEKKIIIFDFTDFKSLEVVLPELPLLYEEIAENYGCFEKRKKIDVETVKEYYKVYIYENWSSVKQKDGVLIVEKDWNTINELMYNYIYVQSLSDYYRELYEPEIIEKLTRYLTEEALVYFRFISKEIKNTLTDEQILKIIQK